VKNLVVDTENALLLDTRGLPNELVTARDAVVAPRGDLREVDNIGLPGRAIRRTHVSERMFE